MNKHQFKIEDEIKFENKGIVNVDKIEVDDTVLNVLNAYKELVKKQNGTINELILYKERELDAFAIGDAVSDAICVADGTGIITAVNKRYTEITGHTGEIVIGKNLKDLIKQGLINRSVTLMSIEQRKKLTVLSTTEFNQKLLITSTPFFNNSGEVIRVMTVMRDMTELIKLKEDLEKVEKESEKYLKELNYLRNKQLPGDNLIGENIEMKKMKELIKYVAKTDVTILITGETGCGKEVVYREIYNESNRKLGPYVKVNCAAIPETLMESELFGYEKGAFTGAQNKGKVGMFEMANGGTILLDEIGEIPLNLQSKMLRVLQEKEIIRVGGTKSISLDVRVIAATNQDLKEIVKKGKFREDLFYRLNVVPIKIPPLRERKDDIFILAYNFLMKYNVKYGKEKSFNDLALHALEGHEWPGNVRELENVIERLIVVDDDISITAEKVMNIIGKNKISEKLIDPTLTLKEAVSLLEKEMIGNAIKNYGSTHKAAKKLGVTQPTVFRKAKALGIKLNDTQ